MRGKLAKRLEKYSRYLLTREGISLGDGFNQYNQLNNYVVWEPAYTDGHRHQDKKDGEPDPNFGHPRMRDPDGNPLSGQFKNPGTIYCAWKQRIIYQNLKRLWKQTKGGHPVFKEFHRTLPKNYFSGRTEKDVPVPAFKVQRDVS